jgi:beta-glucosidase
VPGTVQAANYDTGGQGVAYNVTSVNGSANSYRPDGVDLEATADTQDTSAAGGAYDLGWTNAGQWFNYTIDVATAGTYTVAFRVASPYGITDALHIANAAGTNLTGAVAVPNTGSYETWATVTATVTLPAGQQTLTIDQDSNGWNLHYLAFT